MGFSRAGTGLFVDWFFFLQLGFARHLGSRYFRGILRPENGKPRENRRFPRNRLDGGGVLIAMRGRSRMAIDLQCRTFGGEWEIGISTGTVWVEMGNQHFFGSCLGGTTGTAFAREREYISQFP